MGLRQRWRFLTSYLRKPNVVGAVAPSSQALAVALCEPCRRFGGPARILEVGAGTGAVTRHLGSLLGDEDQLDICEIHPDFADILEQDVLNGAGFVGGVAAGRVRLLRCPVQELRSENTYDFVISGLPLTAFELCDVQDVFTVVRRSLKPGGVFSYFEYVGLRKISWLLSMGRRRRRIRSVSAYLSRNIHEYQFGRTTVLQNLPPAHTRYLRFE